MGEGKLGKMELLNLTGYFSGLQDVCEIAIYPTSGRYIRLEWILRDVGAVSTVNKFKKSENVPNFIF